MLRVSDREVLLGVLAVQLDFAQREALVETAQAWLQDRSKSLGDLLVERQVVTAYQRRLLEPLVDEHLSSHGNDSSVIVESLGASGIVHEAFETQPAEPRLEETCEISDVAATADPEATEATGIAPSIPSDDAGTATRSGQQAGDRYVVGRLHATGGLGAVYLAEDKEFGRPVAVKEMQAKHQQSPTLRARFLLLEAEINARLQHPGIVPVFSLGSFADGRPFYAMRFVEGESLDDAISRYHQTSASKNVGQRVLELRQLLGHFVDLCNAIAYAHSQGVIHRDLKPSNAMLGKFGETLLIDWGLAKSLAAGDESEADRFSHDHHDHDSDREFTRLGSIIGTPAYMSPEQARGDVTEVGPAADIYGLGATLFKLLTGRHALPKSEVTEMLQRISEGEIQVPLEVNPQVPRPLNAICRKAMSLRPADRYPTARDLAIDVERWLADEPTEAYSEPWRDRLGRAVRRHRVVVVGLVVLMLTTIVALGVFNISSRRQNRLLSEARDIADDNLIVAKAENERAEQNLADLQQTAFELQATAEGVLARTPGAESERQRMTELLVEVCEKMHQQRPQQPTLRRDLAQAYRIYGNLKRIFAEREEAQQLYGKALALLSGLVAADPANRLNRDRLAETLRGRSNLHKSVGDIQKAVDDLSRAGQIATELQTDDPTNLGYLRTAATVRQNLADLQCQLGMTDAATSNIAFAVESLTTLINGSNSIPTDQPLLLLALNEQGEMQRRAGQLGESKAALMEALAQARAAVEGGDNNTEHSLARILLNLGQTLAREPSQLEVADEQIEEAIAIWTRLVKAFPSIAFYQRYLAAALTAQAEIRIETGQLDEAVANLEQARKRLEPTVKMVPKMVAYRSVFVDVLAGQARAASASGESEEANKLLAEAITHMEQITTQTPQNVLAREKQEKLRAELKEMGQ